jgi:hypothetical protein
MFLKKYLNFNLIASLLLFSISWTLMNDSHTISRDEMWYADYSVKLNDSKTNDIRHITNIDIHQASFSYIFRYLEKGVVEQFGKNIMGLRVLNLITGMLTVFTMWIFIREVQFKSRYFLLLYTVLITFIPILSNYAHHIRPEWVMMMFSTISMVFLTINVIVSKKCYLYLSAVFAALSAVIYWSGLAILAGILVAYTFLFFENKKDIRYLYSIFIALILAILYYFPLFIFNKDELIGLFSTAVPQTGRILTGHAFVEYWSVFLILLNDIPKSGITGLLTIGFIGSPIFLYFLGKKRLSGTHKKIILCFYIFFISYFLISLLRGAGLRYFYFILPIFIFLNMYICISLREAGDRVIANIYLAGLILLSVASVVSAAVYVSNNNGQWKWYKKYEKDVFSSIEDIDGRLMLTYDFAWLLKERDKFYLENFIFKPSKTYNFFKSTMEEHNITVVLIDETTRTRIDNETDKFGIGATWYQYLQKFLIEKDFKKVNIIYNKYYRKNKEKIHIYEDGYATEIWVRK